MHLAGPNALYSEAIEPKLDPSFCLSVFVTSGLVTTHPELPIALYIGHGNAVWPEVVSRDFRALAMSKENPVSF